MYILIFGKVLIILTIWSVKYFIKNKNMVFCKKLYILQSD